MSANWVCSVPILQMCIGYAKLCSCMWASPIQIAPFSCHDIVVASIDKWRWGGLLHSTRFVESQSQESCSSWDLLSSSSWTCKEGKPKTDHNEELLNSSYCPKTGPLWSIFFVRGGRNKVMIKLLMLNGGREQVQSTICANYCSIPSFSASPLRA